MASVGAEALLSTGELIVAGAALVAVGEAGGDEVDSAERGRKVEVRRDCCWESMADTVFGCSI